MDLYDFQTTAAEKIADRTVAYFQKPIEITVGGETTRVPFAQFLSSITASGKTLILAEAVALISKQLPVPPVVLWLSKATVVVEQSFANLDAGGPYNELLQGAEVRFLSDLNATDLATTPAPFLYFATVGTFNRADRQKGLKVFRSSLDETEKAIWDELKVRPDPTSHRRPLVVVYDEAHNLSDQQTELLLELEPDAFVLATATARLPATFKSAVIERLENLGSLTLDDDLAVNVPAPEVRDSGLIKTEVELIGRQAQATTVITEMHEALAEASAQAAAHGVDGKPKAVYVCKTNVVEGSDEKDSAKQPFNQRKAPPILIWRHLTEQLGVPADEIAVYCNLDTDSNYPLPDDFVLFSGGDKDYENFVAGDYRYVIFNKTLQEGWDEPLVYFAYIDKSMGSKVETEQIVGRLLRQPGRKHYASDVLNMARMFVRVESAGVFETVVQDVNNKIQSEHIPISFVASRPGAKPKREYLPKFEAKVPRVATPADKAESAIAAEVAKMQDYRQDTVNTVGAGYRTKVQRIVGDDAGTHHYKWEEVGESAKVVVRWLFNREVRKVHRLAQTMVVAGNSDGTPSKWDALVGLGSIAASHVADIAEKVGVAYVDNIYLKLSKPNPYVVGSQMMVEKEVEPFTNAVHDGYSGLNKSLELPFAKALDTFGLPWARNPSQTGYSMPVVQRGPTLRFFPDFLVWSDGDVYCIDTKGSHLSDDARRKLVSVHRAGPDTPRVFVRFVLNGHVDEHGPTPNAAGYTTLTFKPNGDPKYVHVNSLVDAITEALVPEV